MNEVKNIFHKPKKMKNLLLAMLLFSGIALNSCKEEFDIIIMEGEAVSLSVSDADLVLNEKTSGSTALSFNWTRGTNKKTGS